MALAVADRVQETTTTSGTGTLSLAGASTGYQSFVSGIGSGNSTYYTIFDPIANVWEVGIGTVTSGSPNTLSRSTVLSNSSGNTSPLTLAGNSAYVYCDYPAEKAVTIDSLASPPAIGGTTANAGSFTTLSASSTVSGTGFSTYLASPPAIGGTTAAAGTFTALTATGAITHNTTTNNQSYTTTGAGTITVTSGTTGAINNMSIGGTTAAAGTFTALTASSTVSGTGFSTYLASPPAIGGTTAAAGTFTTLTATNSITTGGHYSQSLFSGTFTDGIVLDYTTGNGRISVGSADGLTFYNGGVATTALGGFNASGAFVVGSGLSAGTSGQALISNGSSAAPSWGTAGVSQAKVTALVMTLGF